jgi:hypothetical protein
MAKKTSKAWREFEKLVARIERMLCPAGVIVKSPDQIKDLITGEMREVDASIQHQLGSVPILVTLECRRRGKMQDDTWIEQLAMKREKIGAAKTIAVSRSKFTMPAIASAKHYGIELRTIIDITFEDIAAWCRLEHIIFVNINLDLCQIEFCDKNLISIKSNEIDNSIHNLLAHQRANAPILQAGDRFITPNQLLDVYNKFNEGTENAFAHGIEFGSEPVLVTKRFLIEGDEVTILTKSGKKAIRGIALTVRVVREVKLLPPSNLYSYKDTAGQVVEGVEFHQVVGNRRLNMQLYKDKDGHIKFTITNEGKEIQD